MEQARLASFDPHDPATWASGTAYLIDGKLWARCACGYVGRIDTFFGGIHVCAAD